MRFEQGASLRTCAEQIMEFDGVQQLAFDRRSNCWMKTLDLIAAAVWNILSSLLPM